MTLLTLSLLGGFSLISDDMRLTGFRSTKSRALLAFLAMQPDQTHARTQLATLLWGDLPEKSARTNLRVELSHLKKLLVPTPLLQIDRQSVWLNGRLLTTDAHSLQQTLSAWRRMPPERQQKELPALLQAVERYQGDFLAGLHLADAPEFDDWRRLTQERLHESVLEGLDIAQQRSAAAGNWPLLAAAARRQLTLIPWRESAHRYLMQALAAQGQQQAALAQYQTCRAVLQTELGVEPALATQELARRIAADRRAPTSIRHNLPPQLQTFVGRDAETAALHGQVGAGRLVTLLGMGGVGKSRLAQAVAYRAMADFPDGVWFVLLAGIEPGAGAANRIALAIAAAVGWTVTQPERALPALLEQLGQRRMLLVLDNWEHLVEAAEWVVGGLLEQTAVHILATSRLRLNIPGERLFPLAGLPIVDAVTLFIDRARRLLPDFARAADPTEAAAMRTICEQVQGLPLGIELAASWVEHFTVAEIGASLGDIAVAPRQAARLPDRHHSLDAVLNYSWRLLSRGKQEILARLSLFQGGFDRRAAAEVAGSGLSELSILLGHSLLQRVAAGRYDFHPLVQQFVSLRRQEMAAVDPAAAAAARHRFSRHYFALLQETERWERTAGLRGEYENVRQAWLFAIGAADWEGIDTAVIPFSEFVSQFGLMTDGYNWLQTAVDALDGEAGQHELLARLLHRQYIYARAVYGPPEARRLHRRTLELTRDPRLRAHTLTNLANMHAESGEWEEAEICFEQVETLLQQIDDPYMYVNAVEGRIHVNGIHFRGDYGANIKRLESLLPILDGIPDPTSEAEYLRSQVLSSLTTLGFRYGTLDLALRHARANEAWARQIDHRHELSAILLELALSELFAGLLPEALAHNLEALALAREIDAVDDQGLLQANLCLTLRQMGELEQALAYGQSAVAILQKLGLLRMAGQALNRVGHTKLAMARIDAAYATYREAQAVWEPLNHPNAIEATAGLAAAAAKMGKEEEAMAALTAVHTFVAEKGLLGTVEPALLFLHLAQGHTALGQQACSREVLQQAQAWMALIAGRIEETAVRESFLARPDNRRVRELLLDLPE